MNKTPDILVPLSLIFLFAGILIAGVVFVLGGPFSRFLLVLPLTAVACMLGGFVLDLLNDLRAKK